jgi:hypothetical protein
MADVLATLTRRWWYGRRLTEAHREHRYQQLVSEGRLPHWAASLVVAVLSAVSAVLWAATHPIVAGIGTLAVLGLYFKSLHALDGARSRGFLAGASAR